MHTEAAEVFISWEFGIFLRLLVTLFSFIESKRMHCSYKLHMLYWTQQSNRAVCQGNERSPEVLCPQRRARKKIQSCNTWGNPLHSKGTNFALQVIVEEQWMREKNFIRYKEILPVLHFSSHTIVVPVLFFSAIMSYTYSQFLHPYVFCRLSSKMQIVL